MYLNHGSCLNRGERGEHGERRKYYGNSYIPFHKR